GRVSGDFLCTLSCSGGPNPLCQGPQAKGSSQGFFVLLFGSFPMLYGKVHGNKKHHCALCWCYQAVQAFINETWVERHGAEIPTQLLMFLWSSIVSVFGIGGFIGASVGGTKGTLLFNNSFALLAALLMGMSYYADAFELLILGRFLSGVNAGVAICVEPLYLGEIAPRALRGAMAMGTSIFISGGILTGQVMGLSELLGKEGYWPLLLSTTCIPAVLQLLILPWFPESPRYLLIDRGDDHACNMGTMNGRLGAHEWMSGLISA
uniref:Solute carrier family 2 member 11b n=1 Tax=Pygocentrus nattereri TaxID=42514 RepID=A0AAR2JX91_PYGNA